MRVAEQVRKRCRFWLTDLERLDLKRFIITTNLIFTKLGIIR